MSRRFHYTKQPGGGAGGRYRRPRGLYDAPECQASVTVGGRVVRQETIDKWQDGVDAIEAAMLPWRSKPHRFRQMGSLPACEKCGEGRGFRHEGRLIHP